MYEPNKIIFCFGYFRINIYPFNSCEKMYFYNSDHNLTYKVYLHFVFHSSVVHFSAILKWNDAHVNMQKRKFSFSYDPIQKFKNNLCVWSTKRWLDVAAQRVLLRLFIVLTSWQIPPLVSNSNHVVNWILCIDESYV